VNSQSFHNITSGVLNIFSLVALPLAAIWAYRTFPQLSEAQRGWPAHPTVDGCVAVRTPSPLKGKAHYVEAGLTITNNTSKDVVIDSVRFAVLRGNIGSASPQAVGYDVEDARMVTFDRLGDPDMVVRQGTQQALSGFTVRSKETKHYWRGTVLRGADPGLAQFVVQVFINGERDPFGFGRTVWLADDLLGRCPWNSSPA